MYLLANYMKVSSLKMDSSFLISYADDLKNIIKNALVKSETRDWIYAGEEEEFKDMIDTLSKKIM